jgi:hypothetical protein
MPVGVLLDAATRRRRRRTRAGRRGRHPAPAPREAGRPTFGFRSTTNHEAPGPFPTSGNQPRHPTTTTHHHEGPTSSSWLCAIVGSPIVDVHVKNKLAAESLGAATNAAGT